MGKVSIDPRYTPEALNKLSARTLVETLGIEVLTVGDDFISARMPVDHRTHQPYGILHGGASVALAETLGSLAAHCTVNDQTNTALGWKSMPTILNPSGVVM